MVHKYFLPLCRFCLYSVDCLPFGAAAAKSLQSCLTLCDPIYGSPPGSAVPGILQAKTLERVAISFSNAWKWKVKVKSLSRVQLFVTPWTVAYQAPPSMGFSRQEYWSGLPLPSLPLFRGRSFYLRQFHIFIFAFIAWAFNDDVKKSLPRTMLRIFYVPFLL